MDNQIFEKVDDYIAGLFAPEDEPLKQTIQSLEREG